MARANTAEQVRGLATEVQGVFAGYASLLREHKITPTELVFTKQVSKDSGQYAERSTVEKSARDLLRQESKGLKGGQVLRYIITDYSGSTRAVPAFCLPAYL